MLDANVIIVEDDYIIGSYLREILQRQGCRVLRLFSSGKEAVLGAIELEPDLVLMDIMLAGEMDGVEAAQQIKRFREDIPVVFVTALPESEALKRTSQVHPDGFITKPFEPERLRRVVRQALGRNHHSP